MNVDCKFNLAIRKMFNYYIQNGYDVSMIDLNFKGYPHKKSETIDAIEYDEVKVSNVFEVNKHAVEIIGCDNVAYGGVGSRNPERKLPDEIENCEPFYFEDEDTSWGFLTRGCIRNCYFCKVQQHEGKLRPYRTIEQVVKHKKVKFMDNNILAFEDHKNIFRKLAEMKVKVDFNQGLDFRLIDDENAELLSRLNYWGEYFFAFDDWKYASELQEKMSIIKRHISKPWKVKLFIYVNPKMPISDTINRIEWCRRNECLPYIMRDASCYEAGEKDLYTDIAAYCNQPNIFKKMTFEQFVERRHTNKERIEYSKNIWRNNS